MKFKQQIKGILSILVFLNLILSSLLPICRLSFANTDIANESDKTGKESNICLYEKINGVWRYSKVNSGQNGQNGQLNTNLYCAQKGAHVDYWISFKAEGYNWTANLPIFKDEESYKKITWIKNNFWEYIGQNEQDKFTMEEKFKILNSKNNEISQEDVQNVYSDENEIFKLYQMITWKYTKAFGNWTDADLDKMVSSSKESTRKIYNTIINMANEYYNNYEQIPSIEVKQTETITEVTNGECRWGVEINNTSILPYIMEVTVNGQSYTNYTYDNNVLTIKGLDNNESYVFGVSAKSAYVKCEGEVWIAEKDDRQNMLEITEGKKSEIIHSISTNLDVKPEGKFKVEINKKDTENRPLEGVTFDITGEYTGQVTTAKINDETAIATIEEKDIQEADKMYTYTIKELSTKDNMYAKLKEPITINLVSGIERSNNTGKFYYCIKEVKFENGSTERDALLENGKTIRISLTKNIENNNESFSTIISLNLQNEKKKFDLALTKTITSIGSDIINRENSIDTTQLNKTNEETTAKYYLNKKPIEIKKSSIIGYTISVYNEGDIDAKNIEITDYIPNELQICDEKGNTELSTENTITIDGKYIWTVSNENGNTVVKTKIEDTINAFNKNKLESLSVKIYCKIKDEVQSGRLVYNVAEITSAEDTEGTKKVDKGDDRDSEPGSLKDNVIEDYRKKYEDKKKNNEIQDEKNIDKSKYNHQDDDDFEVIKVVHKSLDLSLRKSITKVGKDSANMTEVTYGEEYIDKEIYGTKKEINRLPYTDGYESVRNCINTNSGLYYHKKDAVDVKKGDFVEYSIRIFNEGAKRDESDTDYAGYAKEITDYLPEGLEFYGLVNNDNTWRTEQSNNYKTDESIYQKGNRSYGSYEAQYNKESNTVKIKYVPGDIALQPSNYLLQLYANRAALLEDSGYYNPQYCLENSKPEEYYMYQEVKIVCKVKDDAKDDVILTNLSEITDYAAVEELQDGKLEEQKEVTDKDSSPNVTITNEKTDLNGKNVNLSTYYKDKLVDDEYMMFYPGIEDDDDFENIRVQPTPPGEPEIHKGVKDILNQDSGYNGDEEHDWVINTSIPTGINKFNKYIVTDTIDERLVFDEEKGIEKVVIKIGDKQLVKDTDYKITYNKEIRQLKISFIEGDFIAGKSFEENKVIEIRFNTTFARDENGKIIALNQEIPNQATLIYDNGSGTEKEKESEKPEVHTGAVAVYKYNEKTKVALEGAKFKIATSKENAQKSIFVKDANGKDLEAVSNDKGIAIFTGLEFGGDAYKNEENKKADGTYSYDFENAKKTYYIVETEAPEGFNKYEGVIEVTVSKNTTLTEIKDMESIANKPIGEFDLALRKYITGITNGYGNKQEVTTRKPVFKIDENGEYVYEHTKEPVVVANQNIVEYTIRVYNEGSIAGYAKEIKDDIPEGLEFLPNDELNKKYRWIMLDKEGNETDNVNEAKYIISDYLSKENEENIGENLLKPFNEEDYEAGSINEPDSKEVKVAFKVTMPNTSDEIIINQAQISDDSDEDGNDVTDKDSTPNEWVEGEDDQDIEKIKVLYFDLSLKKWVTKAIVIEDGKETIYETGHNAEDDPEAVVKVDLKKSKLDKVVVKFEYKIRVTNDREDGIPGSVEEISDYIPQGLKFEKADNPLWEEKDGKVVTDQLAGQILQPKESKEVTIVLTWINREDNMGLKVNVAEISKDYNEYGSPDIDSTPNNQVPGEDDIDDAPVMLTVTTGETVMYIGIGIVVLAILAVGIISVKKYVIK